MLVVSDASPLTALLQVGRVDLLARLFEQVIIPPAVRDELLRAHPALPEWLKIQSPNVSPPSLAHANLDAGETEALALEIHVDAVLIDERRGRRVAVDHGLRVIGLLGILIEAKVRGHLPTVQPAIVALREQAGCWFDEELITDVLRAAGESADR